MSNVTRRNPNLSSPLTEMNIEVGGITVQNPRLNNATIRNVTAEDFTNFSDGTVLLDKYVVTDRLPVTSGEANIYVCEYDDEEYIAKIYNRKDAVKSEIVEKLKALDSPYVTKIYDTGEYKGMSVTILPYYRLGSLQGKRFNLKQLKRMVIPSVNDALQSLHNIGILHKDLKPANIMMLSSGKGVALIDFGISSVMDSGASMIITQSGWAPGYSAPESVAPKYLYLEESDYYSFGITLYELFCGYMPYKNFTKEEIMRLLEVDDLPYPEDMPQELQDLITGLTYKDLRNRNDLNNPNRRWTYDEVKKWLAGEKQPIPGGTSTAKIVEESSSKSSGSSFYKFDGKKYYDVNKLVPALAKNWLEGKKHLKRTLLSDFFKRFDPELASYCMDAEEEIKKGNNEDVTFWRLLYKLAPNVEEFFWKNKLYPSLQSFGQEILTKLRQSDMSDKNLWDEVFANRLLSQYLELHSQPKEVVNAVRSLETTNRDRRDGLISYYHTAYLLTGKKELQIEDKKFYTAEELAEHMNFLLDESTEAFENFSNKLIDNDNKLNEEFEAWLIALGKRDELNNWKQNLKTA
ncbi:MAG: protein kinase [Selenomonadaceae bacterium]|nr:protein kinase [Selenomonadaceae bacterium]